MSNPETILVFINPDEDSEIIYLPVNDENREWAENNRPFPIPVELYERLESANAVLDAIYKKIHQFSKMYDLISPE